MEVAPPRAAGDGGRRDLAVRRAVRELALVAALFLAYEAGRVVAAGRAPGALLNGERMWRLERLLHLPGEAVLQQPLLAHELLVRAANCYYAYVHFPATAACLLWLYLRDPGHYRWARRALATLTAAALVLHFLVPLAPPRLTALTGMVDTARWFGPSVYGAPDADPMSNQYAAMPSLHVGWALLVALVLVRVTPGRWRWLWLAHPVATLLVVAATGNHYWLDGLVAAALLGVILAVLPRPGAGPRPAGAAPPAGTGENGRPAPPAPPGAAVSRPRSRLGGRTCAVRRRTWRGTRENRGPLSR